jgi:hypothetical protein
MRCTVPSSILRGLVPLACLALSGCFELSAAVFLNRGYTDDDIVREEALAGRWARADDTTDSPSDDDAAADEGDGPALLIAPGEQGDACFKVTFFDRFVKDWMIAQPDMTAKLCAFRISGQTFLDITRWPEGIDFESMTVTWHWFGALDVTSDELRLKLLHPMLVGEYLREHPLDLAHTRLGYGGDGQIVVTATPQEIQMFLLLHLGLDDLMDEEYVLRKLPPQQPGEGGPGEQQ